MVLLLQPDFLRVMPNLAFFRSCHPMTFLHLPPLHSTEMDLSVSLTPSLLAVNDLFLFSVASVFVTEDLSLLAS